MMKYFNPYYDEFGYVHSIDMVYIEYYFLQNFKGLLEFLRGLKDKYPLLSYEEHLDRPTHSKWDFYTNSVAIGGSYVSFGRVTEFVRDENYNKEPMIFEMVQIRVNPNKHLEEEWFLELLDFVSVHKWGSIRKYDYAIDIPLPLNSVQLFDSRKEKGLFKGTRYLGSAGRNGYTKIYDKQKDMARQGVETGILTRVEFTEKPKEKPSFDTVYVMQNERLNTDYSSLNDTDIAIIEMYLQLKALGVDYDLKLGRRKLDKLKEYIIGSYVPLEFKNIPEILLSHLKNVLNINDDEIITDDNGFLQVPDGMELPFE